ncbi:MAG: hypothetical protein ACHWZW_04765 [Spirulina sp.]
MIDGRQPAPPALVQDRLAAVLQAAMDAPGNGPRLRAAGLVAAFFDGVEQPQPSQGRPGNPRFPAYPTVGARSPRPLIPGVNQPNLRLVADWAERFTQIPILTKAEIRSQPGLFLASVARIAYRGSTSGSRGQAYEFFAGADWNQARIQARERSLAWWGISPAVPILNLNSRLMPGRTGDLALGGPLSTEMMAGLVESLRHTPMALRGYPSRLCEVASELTESLPSVRAVICTGEPLFDHQKHLLEAVFQAPVVNEYGCHESAAFGMTCPEAGRLHLDEHRCFYEILDQHLITTDLWNETIPLVRYQSGDLVQPYATPCPCGRPGLTVDILGRMEDRVTTLNGLVPTGNVPLPPLPGISHYRIQRIAPGQVLAWAKPASEQLVNPSQPQDGLASKQNPLNPSRQDPRFSEAQESLNTWVQDTFGPSRVAITWAESSLAESIPPAPWTDQQWQTVVTQQSLGAWLQTGAMPTGEAQSIAALLKDLVSPTVIGQPLPWVMQKKIADLVDRPPLADPALEILRWRVLLLATSVLPQSQAETLYGQTLDRLQSMPLPASAWLDSLIPSLHLPTEITALAWADLMASQRHNFGEVWPLDPLNAHHLLAAFDGVIHRQAPPKRPPVAKALTPLLAVLVGDLRQWASEFTPDHLLHWIALVQGKTPVDLTDSASTTSLDTGHLSPFAKAWLTWRQRLIQGSSGLTCDSALEQDWHTLKAATPAGQQARLWIEWGYGQRVQGQALDPAQWLPILDTHIPGWLDPAQSPPAGITPWLPIVQALAQPLHRQGQVELAYRCLQVAALAPRQSMAFAALTQHYNTKQAVLVDLLPWQGAEG